MNNQAKLVRTGMLSMAVLAVGTLSVMGVYSAQFSPRAYAMRSIDSAYQSVQNKSPEELAKIQASLGMNPNDALAEARSSKNLREISKEDYDEIVANSSVRGNTLSADPNAPIIGFTSQDSTTIGEDESQPINVEDLGKYETQFGASVDSQQPTSTDMTTEAYTIELPEAKKFLRFTDQDGNDVILSLDVSNVPVFKTIVAN